MIIPLASCRRLQADRLAACAPATEFAERIYRIQLKCRFVATTETARIPEDITGRARRVPVGEVNWRTTFRALRHRNYRLFFYGQLVSLIGTWLQQTAISWFVYEITGSKFLLGAVSAIGSAPMMIFSLWGARWRTVIPSDPS